jgi:hypothetical protein
MKSSGASINKPKQTVEMTADKEAFYILTHSETDIPEARPTVPINTLLPNM